MPDADSEAASGKFGYPSHMPAPPTEIVHDAAQPVSLIRHDGHEVRYVTPNHHTRWRVDTMFTKEPDTLQWIAGFGAGETLFDIGANVGMYSIWAAKTRGVRVLSFEPESQNYAALNLNIDANALGTLVSAYCVAVSDKTAFSTLYLSEFVMGGSCHNFGEPLDPHYQPMRPAFAQGCFATTVDELVAAHGFPVPDHIKIDVDGIEPKVIAGARTTIADTKVKSVLVEINTNLDDHWEIVDFMLDSGFKYSQEQVNAAARTEGNFAGVGNYVFRR